MQEQWVRGDDTNSDPPQVDVRRAPGTCDYVENDFFDHGGIGQYDPLNMKEDAAVIVLGKRRTGKSHTTREMLSKVGDRYHDIVIYTGTKFNGFWQNIIPTEYVHEGFDEYHIDQLLQAKEPIVAECISRGVNGEHAEDCRCLTLVVLDDVASEEHLHGSKALGKLYTKGRHYKIAVWLLTQYAYAMAPAIRSNCDLCVVMHQTQRKSKEAIANEFLAQVHPRVANEILKKYAHDYQCLIIDNSENIDDLDQVLSVYTAAKELPEYHLGDEDYYQAVSKREEMVGTEAQKQDDEMAERLHRPMSKWPHCLSTLDDGSLSALLDV